MALPDEAEAEIDPRHTIHRATPDLHGYAASGLPTRTMGRSIEQDSPFFAAALAAGTALGSIGA